MRNLLSESINAHIVALKCVFEAHDPQGRHRKLIFQELEHVRTKLGRLASTVGKCSQQAMTLNASMNATSVASAEASRTHRWKRTLKNPEQRVLVQRVIFQLQPIWQKKRMVMLMRAWKCWHDAVHTDSAQGAVVTAAQHKMRPAPTLHGALESSVAVHVMKGWLPDASIESPETESSLMPPEQYDVHDFSRLVRPATFSHQRAELEDRCDRSAFNFPAAADEYQHNYREDPPNLGRFARHDDSFEHGYHDDHDGDERYPDGDYERRSDHSHHHSQNSQNSQSGRHESPQDLLQSPSSSSSTTSAYSRNQMENVFSADGRPFFPGRGEAGGGVPGTEIHNAVSSDGGYLLGAGNFENTDQRWESFHLKWQRRDQDEQQSRTSSNHDVFSQLDGKAQWQHGDNGAESSVDAESDAPEPPPAQIHGKAAAAHDTSPSVQTHISAKDFLSRLQPSPQHAASRFRPSGGQHFTPFASGYQFDDDDFDDIGDGVEYGI